MTTSERLGVIWIADQLVELEDELHDAKPPFDGVVAARLIGHTMGYLSVLRKELQRMSQTEESK